MNRQLKKSHSLSEISFWKCTVVVFLIASITFGEASKDPNVMAVEFLNKMRIDSKTPGLQYMIFNSDSILFEYNGGMSDLGDKARIRQRTTFTAYSVTKTFTALAILQLAEAGKLNIEDNAKLYLGYLPYSRNFTINELLNHTSGLPNPIPLKWIHLIEEHEEFDYRAFRRMIVYKYDKLKNTPGKKYSYSNIGYLLLGEIIETASGQEYRTYIRENIIDKLMLPENAYLGFEILDTTEHARGYIRKTSFMNFWLNFIFDKDKFLEESRYGWSQFRFLYVNGDSYGGLIGNATGFAIYLQSLLSDTLLLSDPSKAKLFNSQQTTNGKTSEMCLGWFTGKLGDEVYFAHPGGGGGYYCEIRLYPGLNIASVILFNRTGTGNEKVLDDIDKIFLGK